MAVSDAVAVHGNALEQQDLRRLVLDGHLNDTARGLGADQSVLKLLRPLAEGGKTDKGADRWQLLDQLVQDLSRPEQMLQGKDNADCAGTAAAYTLAKNNPADYVRAVTALAEKGSLDLNGARFTMDGFNREPGRSTTQQLFANTFVETAGKERVSLGGSLSRGINAGELKAGMSALNGTQFDALYVAQSGEGSAMDRVQTRGEAERLLRESSATGKPVLVNVGNHWVAVTATAGEGPDAKVSFVDGGAAHLTSKLSDFLDTVDSMVFDPSVYNPSTHGDPRWGDDGGGGSAKGGINGGDD